MSNTSKVVWALGLLSVFLFVLITGRTNVRNFELLRDSIEEIYEDRLVVNGLIFDLSTLLHGKEVALITDDESYYRHLCSSVNAQIHKHIEDFRATKLTSLEAKTLERFASKIAELEGEEESIGLDLQAGIEPNPTAREQYLDQIESLHLDLKTLSRIQLSEGRRRVGVSDKATTSMKVFARIENYMLGVTAVLLLALVFIVPRSEQGRGQDG